MTGPTLAPKSVLERAVDYVRALSPEEAGRSLELDSIGVGKKSLLLPRDCAEYKQFEEASNLVTGHLQSESKKPISIAVFGPPGSGKSTFVSAIAEGLPNVRGLIETNLSQLADVEDLAAVFRSAAVAGGEPWVFFFDEFDASLGETPLGWLRWFLAPMQDGKFSVSGAPIPVGKAIFFFAGGTAGSLAEFDRRARSDSEAYRARKVPDFISRLRSSIDIGGINSLDDDRHIRRAVVLRSLLERRHPASKDQDWQCPLGEPLVQSCLSHGFFTHGVRSMEAVVDLWLAQKPDSAGSARDLPATVRAQHLSRGILDGRVVGISAGRDGASSKALLPELTRELLRHGATLAYGGDFVPKGTLELIRTAVHEAPEELVKRDDKRVRNYLGFPVYWNPTVVQQRAAGSADIESIELHTLSDAERKALHVPDDWFVAMDRNTGYSARPHVAWALSLFRMRLRMVQDISALVVIGGNDDGMSWGRFAGIAEEVMLALLLRKPVYVLGGAGGAALAVGRLLGMDSTAPNPRECVNDRTPPAFAAALARYRHCFSVPGVSESPFTLDEVREQLYHRGVTTSAWPWNGLTVKENRDLFRAALPEEPAAARDVVGTIVQGLSRLQWKGEPGSSD